DPSEHPCINLLAGHLLTPFEAQTVCSNGKRFRKSQNGNQFGQEIGSLDARVPSGFHPGTVRHDTRGCPTLSPKRALGSFASEEAWDSMICPSNSPRQISKSKNKAETRLVAALDAGMLGFQREARLDDEMQRGLVLRN